MKQGLKSFNIIIFVVLIIVIICIIGIFGKGSNWMTKYQAQLNKFFGEGNWECVHKELKEGIMISDPDVKFTNWHINYNNNDKEDTCVITNYTLIYNNKKNGLFSKNRLSDEQAFYLELMHISFDIVGEEILDEFVRSELSENEAKCFYATIKYRDRIDDPKFYEKLYEQEWFTVDKVSAKDYLTCDLQDFYISINAFDYDLSNLTDEERQHVFDSLDDIERKLFETYGERASFEIYIDVEHRVEYIDGIKQ